MPVQRKFITQPRRCHLLSKLNMVLPVNLSVPVSLLRWAYCQGDSRLPAECRGSTGEADDAEPESLDSGPQVLLNLLRLWKFMMGLLLGEVGRSVGREGGCCVWLWCFGEVGKGRK